MKDKKPAHRPSEYDSKFCDMAEEYLKTCGREQTKLPKVTEFYRMIGISRQCGDEWADKYPEFGDTIKKIMEFQQEELIDDGLFGGREVNAAMAIFLLKANHGMIEKNATDITTGGKPIINMDAIIGLGNSTTETTDSDSNAV